jgi:hypothetical protein
MLVFCLLSTTSWTSATAVVAVAETNMAPTSANQREVLWLTSQCSIYSTGSIPFTFDGMCGQLVLLVR